MEYAETVANLWLGWVLPWYVQRSASSPIHICLDLLLIDGR
jgi:hypothetical protein